MRVGQHLGNHASCILHVNRAPPGRTGHEAPTRMTSASCIPCSTTPRYDDSTVRPAKVPQRSTDTDTDMACNGLRQRVPQPYGASAFTVPLCTQARPGQARPGPIGQPPTDLTALRCATLQWRAVQPATDSLSECPVLKTHTGGTRAHMQAGSRLCALTRLLLLLAQAPCACMDGWRRVQATARAG